MPIGAVFAAVALYLIIQRCRRKLETEADRREFFATITYGALLFVYIVLPSISAYVITFFSCTHFDRGDGRDLVVVASELSIKCTGRRYRRWRVYDAMMVALYPAGMTSLIAVLLWSNRAKVNPRIQVASRSESSSEREAASDGDGRYARELRRHQRSLDELAKSELRDADDSIAGLKFLYDEYEPRCYLFPIFEILRRLFLSSVLLVFYPGSMEQVVVGLFGAIVSALVFIFAEAFIESDDNVVAVVSEFELVLVYFGAVVIFTSENTSEQQQRGTYSGYGFGIVLVVVIFAGIDSATCLILLDVFGCTSLHEAATNVLVSLPSASPIDSRAAAGPTSEETKQPQQHGCIEIELAQSHDANV